MTHGSNATGVEQVVAGFEIAEALGKERMMIFDAMVSAVLEDPRSRAS